jgi:hypothetical protein
MGYFQKSTPPPNKTMTFSLRNFVGGLNNKSEELQPNQASSLMNMRFVDDTVMENRYGQKYYDDFVLDGEEVFIDAYKPYTDPDVLLCGTASKMYVGRNLLTTLSGKPCGINHMGKYFFVDGAKFYVYGKFAQETSTYVKVIGTPINDYVLLEITSPADNHARLDTSHVQGVTNIDYTNKKIFYEPCENEFVDTYKGANVVPTNIKYIVSHNGRIYASGDTKDNDNCFISNVQNPYYFPVSLPMQLNPNSDMIVGMKVYDDCVVIGRKNDIYTIEGDTNNPTLGANVFKLRKLNTHTGFANNDAVCVAHNNLFFIGYDGNAYSMSSAKNDEKILSTTVLTKNVDITKEPINLTIPDVVTTCSIFIDDLWYVSIKDKVLVYSYNNMAWTVYKDMNARSFFNINRELVWGRPDGRIATFDKENYLDFGLPYQAYWYSKRFDMDDANSYKQFREFFVIAHTFNDYPSDINVLFEIDYDDVHSRAVIKNRISVWGKTTFGERFINRNINESMPFIIGRRGRNIRFKLSCSYYKDGEVATYGDLEHYLGKKDGLLVKVLDVNKYYLYMDGEWLLTEDYDLNQRMKIYQINGDYELRGKR